MSHIYKSRVTRQICLVRLLILHLSLMPRTSLSPHMSLIPHVSILVPWDHSWISTHTAWCHSCLVRSLIPHLSLMPQLSRMPRVSLLPRLSLLVLCDHWWISTNDLTDVHSSISVTWRVHVHFRHDGRLCKELSWKGKHHLQGGEDPQDAFSCRSFFAKEPLIIGLFCGKWPIKIRHPMGLRHPELPLLARHNLLPLIHMCHITSSYDQDDSLVRRHDSLEYVQVNHGSHSIGFITQINEAWLLQA